MRISFAELLADRVAVLHLIPVLLSATAFLFPFVDCLLSLFLGYSRELNYLCNVIYWIERILFWLSRMPYSCGFGIQSPNDYWLVRNVINEHWPYYQYSELGKDDDALTRKLGKLYFRLANWWQPPVIASEKYQAYLSAGCRRVVFSENIEAAGFIVLRLEQGTNKESFMNAYNKVKDSALLVVEGIQTNKEIWKGVAEDSRATIIFDLYYCGIVFFDKKRYKHYYKVNF